MQKYDTYSQPQENELVASGFQECTAFVEQRKNVVHIIVSDTRIVGTATQSFSHHIVFENSLYFVVYEEDGLNGTTKLVPIEIRRRRRLATNGGGQGIVFGSSHTHEYLPRADIYVSNANIFEAKLNVRNLMGLPMKPTKRTQNAFSQFMKTTSKKMQSKYPSISNIQHSQIFKTIFEYARDDCWISTISAKYKLKRQIHISQSQQTTVALETGK